jgi:predicted RNA-binding protein with PUA-like domain
MAKKYWIMKSEPNEFSIDDLERVGQYFWDGVRNYQVRNMFRDVMKVGDLALFYHSSCEDVGVVGEMEISEAPQTDPSQFNKKSKYYDAKSTKEDPRWLGPTVLFKKKFKRLVSLSEIKLNPIFATLPLVKKGNRLSCFPITKEHFDALSKLAK